MTGVSVFHFKIKDGLGFDLVRLRKAAEIVEGLGNAHGHRVEVKAHRWHDHDRGADDGRGWKSPFDKRGNPGCDDETETVLDDMGIELVERFDSGAGEGGS